PVVDAPAWPGLGDGGLDHKRHAGDDPIDLLVPEPVHAEPLFKAVAEVRFADQPEHVRRRRRLGDVPHDPQQADDSYSLFRKSRSMRTSGNRSQTSLIFPVRDSPRNWRTKSRRGRSSCPFSAAAMWLKASFLIASGSYHHGEVRSVGRNLR